MTDLGTTYLGFRLSSPLVASASPLTGDVDRLQALEAAGIGAVVLPSLFEEQVALEAVIAAQVDASNWRGPRDPSHVDLDDYNAGPGEYLRLVGRARRRLEIPVIASLNCARPTAWSEYARMLESAGASAIELNVLLVPTDPEQSSEDVEARYAEVVSSVAAEVSIPVAVKLAASFTAPVHFARRLEAAGARGLVLFHRPHLPAIDLQRQVVEPRLSLSTPLALGLRLRWIGILRDRVGLSLAATGGVWSGDDALQAVLAGADAVMVASVLLEHGPEHVEVLTSDLVRALAQAGLPSVDAARGTVGLGPEGTEASADRVGYLRALLGVSERVRR